MATYDQIGADIAKRSQVPPEQFGMQAAPGTMPDEELLRQAGPNSPFVQFLQTIPPELQMEARKLMYISDGMATLEDIQKQLGLAPAATPVRGPLDETPEMRSTRMMQEEGTSNAPGASGGFGMPDPESMSSLAGRSGFSHEPPSREELTVNKEMNTESGDFGDTIDASAGGGDSWYQERTNRILSRVGPEKIASMEANKAMETLGLSPVSQEFSDYWYELPPEARLEMISLRNEMFMSADEDIMQMIQEKYPFKPLMDDKFPNPKGAKPDSPLGKITVKP